ncbi:hypothetical protein JCM8547_001964 [Rhodosporidiobolus lusitaniae]
MPSFPRPPLLHRLSSTNSGRPVSTCLPSPTAQRSPYLGASSPPSSALPPVSPTPPPPQEVVIKVFSSSSSPSDTTTPSSPLKLLILPAFPVPPLSAVASRSSTILSLPPFSDTHTLSVLLVEREVRWPGDEPEKIELDETSWMLYAWKKAVKRSGECEPVKLDIVVREKKSTSNGADFSDLE